MPSQYSEHLDILRYFEGRPGRFLDVGAGDGLTLSNTEPLLHVGWSGVMVEPAISQLRWLIENHQDNPNVDILPVALAAVSGLAKLHDARNYSTTLASFRRRIEQGCGDDVKYRERYTVVVSWDYLALCVFPGAQFINIDVEGNNLNVLETLPFQDIKPEMVCVEIDPEEALPRMMDILAAAGLGYAKRIGGNLLAARKEIL